MNIEQLKRKVIECRKCDRLVQFREKIALEKRKAYSNWEYWGKPVPGFGSKTAKILVLGLAPAAHGGNPVWSFSTVSGPFAKKFRLRLPPSGDVHVGTRHPTWLD